MKTSTAIWIVVIIIVVLGGWYWWSAQTASAPAVPTTTVATTSAPTTITPPPPQTVTLGTSTKATLGNFLVADNGMTLYTFKKDSTGTTTCYAACAQKWPPYTVASGVQLAAPIGSSGMVSTITRADDGSQQVTYNGMPLYFYASDAKPGDIKGEAFAKLWYVVKP